jgi:UDPglucose 6-dehydrogenase
MKIVFANSLMEICHKITGTNVDEVTNALKLAHRRLISGSYLSGGMGDGGGCHPRDNIAMSCLARTLNLSCDFFEDLMMAREKQTEWLADLMCKFILPKAILGYSFKPKTNITVGSPALLLKNILEERGEKVYLYDPYVDRESIDIAKLKPMIFLIGTKHPIFTQYSYPSGSVVIDPWRYIEKKQKDVKIISLGKNY